MQQTNGTWVQDISNEMADISHIRNNYYKGSIFLKSIGFTVHSYSDVEFHDFTGTPENDKKDLTFPTDCLLHISS